MSSSMVPVDMVMPSGEHVPAVVLLHIQHPIYCLHCQGLPQQSCPCGIDCKCLDPNVTKDNIPMDTECANVKEETVNKNENEQDQDKNKEDSPKADT